LRGKRYNGEKQAHGGQVPGSSSGQNVHSLETTAEKLSTEYNVDEKTIRRDGQFAAAVDSLALAGFEPQARITGGYPPAIKSHWPGNPTMTHCVEWRTVSMHAHLGVVVNFSGRLSLERTNMMPRTVLV
jgi:hypothetical protein